MATINKLNLPDFGEPIDVENNSYSNVTPEALKSINEYIKDYTIASGQALAELAARDDCRDATLLAELGDGHSVLVSEDAVVFDGHFNGVDEYFESVFVEAMTK